MNSISRRRFLQATSAGVGLLAGSQFLLTPWARAQSPDALLAAQAYDKSQLRALAMGALEAAKAAGATFADVRILSGQTLELGIDYNEDYHGFSAPRLTTTYRIGIRAVAGSTFGFAGSVLDLNADKVASLARLAVERSKAGAPRQSRAFEFAPAPVVNGTWRTPVEIDPFSVPVNEQQALLREALDEALKIKMPGRLWTRCNPTWLRKDDLFASTEGSLIEQRIYTSATEGRVTAFATKDNMSNVWQEIESIREGGVGYEALSKANLKKEWPETIEGVVQFMSRPAKSAEVGRYDIVLSADATAQLVATTIGRPLQLDRALLLVANVDGKGTTYAMPPAEVLGKFQLGNELLNVTADRSRQGSGATVGWDSEGVKPDDFTLVRNGTVVDYVSTRETAPALREWYKAQGLPLRSHGCAWYSGGMQPDLGIPNLTLKPGPAPLSVDDLIRDVKHGFYIDGLSPDADQSGVNVQAGGTFVEEIVNGKRSGRVENLAIQFSTPQFWKGLDALGGSKSAETTQVTTGYPEVEDQYVVGVTTVPIRVRKVNVVNTGKKA